MVQKPEQDYEPGPVRASYSRLGPPSPPLNPVPAKGRAVSNHRYTTEVAAEISPPREKRVRPTRRQRSKRRA